MNIEQATTLPAPALLNIKELAYALRLHPTAVRTLYKAGRIPGLKFGYRTLRFDLAAVLDALRKESAVLRFPGSTR